MPDLRFANIRASILNTPLLCLPEHARGILNVLAPHIGIASINGAPVATPAAKSENPDSMAGVHPDDGYGSGDPRPYSLEHGVAFIPVHGTIVKKYAGMNSQCDMTSTEALKHVFQAACEAPDVKAIYLDIDSSGGQAAGTFDAVEHMMMLKRKYKKTVFAHANELAASAAYAIASVADHLSAPFTAQTGSVGVIVMLADYSNMLENAGIKINIIRRGARKAETNPYEPLSERAREKLQTDVDDLYDHFVASVTENRAALTRDTVVGTESALLSTAEAKRLGFIDDVMSEEQAFVHAVTRAS